MPRPKKQEDARRTERINPAFTPAERLQIETAALAAGVSASEYVRRMALAGRVVIEQSRALDHATFIELKRIGVNIGQLTRIANQTGRLPPGLARAAADLQKILVRELEHGS